MRMDFEAGTYLMETDNPEGERMSFTRMEEAPLSSARLDPSAFTRKLTISSSPEPYSMVKENHYGKEEASGRAELLD